VTDEQFERWEDAAIRMAKHCYPNATEARRKRILEEVKEYFHWRHCQKDWPQIRDWDGNKDDYYLCDQVQEFFDDHYHYIRLKDCYGGKFWSQIVCCIQVAFGMAVEPSLGGVIGFTAGDIRRMWNGNIPDWIKADWKDENENDINFDAMPDETGLWL
jgi:hypothetical protein